jgi:hypothetical protein
MVGASIHTEKKSTDVSLVAIRVPNLDINAKIF